MKKFLLIIVVIITMVSCSEKKEPVKQYNDIWLFHIGEAREEVEKTLKKNHYEFANVTDDALMTVAPTVNYLGIDWDNLGITFDNDTITALLFTRVTAIAHYTEQVSPSEITRLQDVLSAHYGEMRENRKQYDKDTKIYVWFKGDLSVELINMFNGEAVNVAFFSEGHNPRDYEVK